MNALIRSLLRRPWLTAGGLAAGLHLAWGAWLPAPHPLRDGRPAPAGTRVRYEAVRSWRDLLRTRRDDARLLYSSALFALPTPMGFSGPEWEREIRHAPMLAASSLAPTTAPSPELRLRTDPRAPLWRAGSTSLVPVAVTQPPIFSAAAPLSDAVLQVRWSADFPGALPRSLPATESVWDDAASWEIAAAVRYDERGVLREVFLDPPGPRADRNAAVVRLIHRLPVPTAASGRTGRVILRYSGPPGGAAT